MRVGIPEELARGVAEGQAVLFARAGMSQSAVDLPGWKAPLERKLEWARKERIALGPDEESIRELIGREAICCWRRRSCGRGWARATSARSCIASSANRSWRPARRTGYCRSWASQPF
jgi:hypothetical protein